jgi:hypothetical protein
MNAGPPQPEDISPRSSRGVRAAWGAAAGVILGTSAVICLAVGVISGEQALAMALPAVLLIVGGLVVMAMPEPATGQRRGFRAGLFAGSLRRRWRGVHRRRNGGLAWRPMAGLNEEALAFGIDVVGSLAQEILHCLNVLRQIHPRPEQYRFIGNFLDGLVCQRYALS